MKISEIKISYINSNKNKVKITNSEGAYKLLLLHWDMDTIEFCEEVKILLLNRANLVLGIYNLSKGGVSQCVIDIKIILSIALKANASSIIMAHNHPSGNLTPSEQDKTITERLKQACKVVDLTLLDHLIISKEGFYSFCDRGLFC